MSFDDEEEPWIPQVGEVIFNASDGRNEDAWDDTELIEHWDAALAEYKRLHGTSNEDEPPFSNTPAAAKKPRHNRNDKDTEAEEPTAGESVPADNYLQPPPENDDTSDLTNLVMAWYYSGYYTGYYQGLRSSQ